MTKKFPTDVLMDGIAILWSNYANSLSSILYTVKKAISTSRGPGASQKNKEVCMTKNVRTGVPIDGVVAPWRSIANPDAIETTSFIMLPTEYLT